MKTLTTETFCVQYPEIFDQSRSIWETIRLENNSVEYLLQNPELNLGLAEIADYDEYPGDTFEQRYCASVKKESSTTIWERGELKVADQTVPYVIAERTLEWNETTTEVLYFYAAIAVDEAYGYVLQAFCEPPHQEQFQPLFFSVFKSLRWFGDRSEALAKQQAALDALIPQGKDENEAHEPPIKPFQIPTDGKDVFRIDDFNLEFGSKTVAQISGAGDPLYLNLSAEVPDDLPDQENLVDYPGEGLGFRLNCAGIHQHGIPTGSFQFRYGKSEDRNTYLWDDGWQYSLEFTGTVTLAEGWVGMNGYLSKEYEDTRPYEVEIYKRLELERLDWSNYKFLSLEETEGAKIDDVRHLQLADPQGEVLDSRVFRFTELRNLSIFHTSPGWNDPSRAALKELPESLGALRALEDLHLNRLSLKTLPESAAKLRNLVSLAVSHCCLETLPEGVWHLPKLERLYLSNNQLTALPKTLDLPSLRSVNLRDNLFKTLPESLAEQTQLKDMELQGNPLEALPEAFNLVESIDLSLADKHRLLDFEYGGADGSGTIPWPKKAYLASHDPSLWAEFTEQLATTEYACHAEALKTVVKKAVVFDLAEQEDEAEVGETRFGGWPDLPKGMNYPSFEEDGRKYLYEFIAQIRCQDLAPLQDFLPRSGWLFFFLHSIHDFDAKVLYFEGEPEELFPGKELDFPSEDFFDMDDPPYQGYKARSRVHWSLPHGYSAHANEYLFQGIAASLVEEDMLDELDEEIGSEASQNLHEINSYVFTQNESPELQAALRYKGHPQDWVVLLKVASQGDFQWWDAGELFFVIHKSDLEKRDFSKIYCSLESS